MYRLVSQGRDIIVGNVGDSRAVLCTRDKDDTLMAIQLTVDLKPNLPGTLFISHLWVWRQVFGYCTHVFLYIYLALRLHA